MTASSQRLLVKICGNRYLPDALRVADVRPDFMGWIFSPASPRRIPVPLAARLIARIRLLHPRIRHVGVFAHNSITEIRTIRDMVELEHLQVVAPSGFVRGCRRLLFEFGGCAPLIPAVRVRERLLDSDLSRYGPASLFVLDSFVPGRPGGTGVLMDTGLVRDIRTPFLLAGGLNAENVAAALRALPNVAGADVSSGIEVSPGRKDPEKLHRFIAAVRSARAPS